MMSLKIDVMVLIDTRHKEVSCKSYTLQVKSLLGPYTKCIHSPVATHTTKKGKQTASVGGQLIILNHAWAGALIDHFQDPSNLGLVLGVRLSTGQGSLMIMGNYWPYPSADSTAQQGLWARASQYLKNKKIKLSPKEYIQKFISMQSDRHVAKSNANTTIVCGDFNHRWNTGKYQFQQWADSNNWGCPSVFHSESSGKPIYTYTKKGADSSWIDHHIIAPSSAASQVLSTTSFNGPYWSDVSDHRPLMIHMSVLGGRGTAGLVDNPHPRSIRSETKPFLDKEDKKRVRVYRSSLAQYRKLADPPLSAEHAWKNLLNLTMHSVVVASKVFPSKGSQSGPRSSYKDGWSPTAIAMKYQMIAILDILGHIQGTKGRHIWRDLDDQSIGIVRIVETWVKSVLKLNWTPPSTGWDIMDSSGYGPVFWKTLDTMATVSFCIDRLDELKLKLHGKQRQKLRESINKAVQLREKMVKDGKLKRYNQAVLREQVTPNPLTSVTLSTGEILQKPLEVHLAHTEHYEKAFATPPQHAKGIHETGENGWNWETGGTKDDFLKRIHHHGIPVKYQDILWNAMQAHPSSGDVKEELVDTFDTPPSFHEFCNAISAKPGKTSGGISGLTYEHMKIWSKQYKRDVYNNLIKAWTSEDAPDWWKWRWLCPIPKTAEDNTLAGQRPIILVEVVRKTWIALIIHRVNVCWKKYDMLHPSQHGFRSSRGTDTALLGLQAMFEQSASSDSPLYLSSWDISKAFDSPSKNVLRFAWSRLGVPKNISNFLVSLDEGGHTIVRTPYSQNKWNRKRYAGFPEGTEKTKALFLDAVRGTGQGDVGSPLNWDALFDILLCALSMVKENRFYTHGSTERLYPIPDIAYADDLLSGMSTMEGIQEKAKIVSAFAIVFGLDIAKTKLRSFIHNSHTLHSSTPRSFFIYTSGWVAHSVPIATAGSLKSLGMVYDISSTQLHKTQFELTKLRAERSCNIIRRTRGSRAQLRVVVSTCIAKRAEYTGKFSSWTESQMDELDKVFTQTYKQLSSNHSTYPDALVYLPRELGGLGYPKVSDSINSAKHSIQQRHLRAGGMIAEVMDTVLYNGVVHSSQVPSLASGVVTYPSTMLSSSCWANSLLRFAAEGDLFLCRQGPLLSRTSTTSIISASRPTNQVQPWRYVHDRHISLLGDLYSYTPGSPPTWHDFSETGGRALSELQVGNPPEDVISLRVKQYWRPSRDSIQQLSDVVEIMGFTNDDPPLITIRILSTNNHDPVYRLQFLSPPDSSSLLGGATTTSLTPLQALGSSPSRVYLDPPPSGSHFFQIGFISEPTSYKIPHSVGLPSWLPSELLLSLPQLGPFTIFTDGSWTQAGSSFSHVTGNGAIFHGSAGIVIISDLPNWRELPILTLQIDNGQELGSNSAYSMEVLGISVGLSIASQLPGAVVTICSDCQAAVRKLHKNRRRPSALRAKTRDSSLLGVSISLWNSMDNLTIKWVKGHPEKVEPDASLWTREMWGNHLADRAAAGALTSSLYQYQNLFSNAMYLTPFPPMEALALTARLAPLEAWYFGTTKRELLSTSMLDCIHRKRLTRYLVDRDQQRFDRAKLPPKWQHYDIPLAAKLWGISSSAAYRCLKNRLIFDKHFHSGNRAKSIKDPVQSELASQCPFCTCSDSASHWSVQCTAIPRSVDIRTKALLHIRNLIKTAVEAHTDADFKVALRYLGDDYLSFLDGDRKSPEVWMGLWTTAQLDQLGTNEYYPYPLLAALKKLFFSIGNYLTETIIQLWQSRQLAECELAQRNASRPIPNYKEPTYLLRPPNLSLIPHTEMEMEAITQSASEVVPPAPVKVNNSSKTTRKLCRVQASLAPKGAQALPSVEILTPSPLSAQKDAPVSSVTQFTAKFKRDKRKRRKSRPTQTLVRKFRNMAVKATKPHWRTVKNAPSSEVVQTPVTELLRMNPSIDGSMFRKRIPSCFPISYPLSPPRARKIQPKGGVVCTRSTAQPSGVDSTNSMFRTMISSPPSARRGNRSASSASLTACHSPVRGHDPGLKLYGACLALVM
jgi:ribonuclease HI